MKHDPEHDDDLGDVMRSVDDLAAFEAELIESASRIDEAPGEEHVHAALEAAFVADRAQGSSRWIPVGVAAAILLAVGIWWGLRPSEDTQPVGPSGTYLDDGAFEFLDPVRTSDGWTLTWRGPELSSYELTFKDNSDGTPLLGPVRVNGYEYQLTKEVIQGWPSEVYLELGLWDSEGLSDDTANRVLMLDGSR